MEQNIWIPGKQWKIAATLSIPMQGSPFPCVVMMHGTGSCRDEVGDGYKRLALLLTERGIASIRFDFAGSGDSTVDYCNYTISSALQDGRDVLAYSAKQSFIDGGRLGMIGWSQGGMLAIMTAAREHAIKSLVTWACALKMDFYWTEYREKALQDGYVTIDPGWRPPLNVSAGWFNEAADTDAATFLPDISADVLAICGSQDPFDFQKNLPVIMNRVKGKHKQQWLVEGGNHVFNIDTEDSALFMRVASRTAEWFENTLKDED